MFNYGHIYHYLVEEVVNVTLCGDAVDEDGDVESADDTTAKPLRKGKGLFQSGFVTDVQDCHDNSYYYIKSHVHHSMKNDIPLNASATISKINGFIKKATCTCRAKSLERCCHIAALLIYLSDYVTKNGCTVNQPSTSLPCSWNQGKKRKKNPIPVQEARYESSKRGDPSKLYGWDPRPIRYRKASNILMNNFVRDMQGINNKGTPSMWETVLKVKHEDFEIDAEEKRC